MRSAARSVLATFWIAAICGLLALGTWQVERRSWKLALIERVERALRAPPVPAPPAAGRDDAYRRIYATGTFLPARDSFVQASTVRGPGFWTMTPLDDGARILLVNRGWVPRRAAPPPPPGRVTVTGLLRLSEPGGGFLRSNDPAANRWHSRDVAAIAARHGLSPVTPYFIDRDAAANAPGQPVGGLTVIAFHNSHLVYAVTWYVLAAMTAAAFAYWVRTR